MEVKPGYKQTEVGVIPEEWDVKPLGSILSKGRLGGNYPNQDHETDYPLMKMGNIARGYIDTAKVEYIAPGITPDTNHRLCSGDVLFNTRNTLDLVGKVAVWRNELSVAYYNSNLMRLEFDPKEICSKEYANYALNSAGGVARLRALATGTTSVAAIYTRDLLGMPFIVPPPPEQRTIAGALSDVDALIRALDQIIAKKRDLKQAAMQQLLTGKQRLPGFDRSSGKLKQTEAGEIPEDWEITEVKEVTCNHKQGFYTKDRYVDNGVRLLRITDLMNPHIDYAAMPMLHISKGDCDLYKIKIGDFLFARSGAIGRYGIVYEDVDAIFGSYIIRFVFDSGRMENEYFGYLYETEAVWKQLLSITQGSSNININAANIKSIKILLPSIKEQRTIAAVLSDMDAELAALEQRRDKTRALKQGMMQELLTGRTRLPFDEGTPCVA